MTLYATQPINEVSHPTVAHYDIDAEFFASFLDPYLKYTCGLFDQQHQDLDSAAVNMLDYLISKACLPRQARVLEIGSGWGSLLRRFKDTQSPGNPIDYIGISPSGRQNAFIREEIAMVPLLQTNFESLTTESLGHFDAIFLVGSFCHLAEKPAQLRRLAKMLRPSGRIVIEDSFFLSQKLFEQHAHDPRTEYLQKQVFGYAEIPSLADFTDMVRGAGLRLQSLDDTTDSYHQTIAIWLERLKQAPARYDSLKESFIKYLSIAQAGWNYTTSNYVATLEKLPVRSHLS